jgi:probable F420-dependent oxidoreductase
MGLAAMKIGIHLRNAGAHATREMLAECARIADELPIDDLWVFDHLAIPPEESEGSGGLYVEPLATLAFVAGITERVSIGTRVLILPYRPALLTAKWIASIQMLSGGRLRIGAGVGWMEAEFRALGVERSRRGAITDETLELFNRCFAADEVEVNGQPMLFLPRPARPPIYIGGKGEHALRRAARFADGWAPTGSDPASYAHRSQSSAACSPTPASPSPRSSPPAVCRSRTTARFAIGWRSSPGSASPGLRSACPIRAPTSSAPSSNSCCGPRAEEHHDEPLLRPEAALPAQPRSLCARPL